MRRPNLALVFVIYFVLQYFYFSDECLLLLLRLVSSEKRMAVNDVSETCFVSSET